MIFIDFNCWTVEVVLQFNSGIEGNYIIKIITRYRAIFPRSIKDDWDEKNCVFAGKRTKCNKRLSNGYPWHECKIQKRVSEPNYTIVINNNLLWNWTAAKTIFHQYLKFPGWETLEPLFAVKTTTTLELPTFCTFFVLTRNAIRIWYP